MVSEGMSLKRLAVHVHAAKMRQVAAKDMTHSKRSVIG